MKEIRYVFMEMLNDEDGRLRMWILGIWWISKPTEAETREDSVDILDSLSISSVQHPKYDDLTKRKIARSSWNSSPPETRLTHRHTYEEELPTNPLWIVHSTWNLFSRSKERTERFTIE
jgi:hypothetical protein